MLMLVLVACFGTVQAAQIMVSVLSPNGKPLQGIVVYLTHNDVPRAQPEGKSVKIYQQDKAFRPYVNVVQKGQTVAFVNKDNITHHIFSSSRESRFALKLRAGEGAPLKTFEHSGSISMACNIHDWMSGHLLVVDTPYFGKTSKSGTVAFELNYQGKVTVTIWHPQMQQSDRAHLKELMLSEESQHIDFRLTEMLDDIPSQESGEDFEFLDDY